LIQEVLSKDQASHLPCSVIGEQRVMVLRSRLLAVIYEGSISKHTKTQIALHMQQGTKRSQPNSL